MLVCFVNEVKCAMNAVECGTLNWQRIGNSLTGYIIGECASVE